MNKKISLGAAIAFMVVVAGITLSITMMISLNHFNTLVLNVKNREEFYKKIADLDREVRQNYDGLIDEEKLMDYISRGYIRGLDDKYSSYLSKTEYEQRLKEISGKQVGIGIDYTKDETGYILIKKIIPESPAEKEGLKVGDYIVSINDTDLKAVTAENIDIALKGEVGTKVKIVFRSDGVDTTKDIIRTDISVPVVEMQMLESNAYIKIIDFNDTTYIQFKEKIDTAIKNGATGIIFDIRNNGGGTLSSVISMLDMLLPSGDIATKIDNKGVKSVIGTSDKYEINIPMVTLINGKTASASELFAAALRDYKKSSLVGTTTYGKGVMQTLIKLTDGSAINLTTAHFFPPSGQPINDVGVKPDYEVKLTPEQDASFDTLTLDQDPQVLKAIGVIDSMKE